MDIATALNLYFWLGFCYLMIAAYIDKDKLSNLSNLELAGTVWVSLIFWLPLAVTNLLIFIVKFIAKKN